MASLKEMLMEKKAKIASGTGERTKTLKTGKTVLRILPSWEKGSLVFYHDFGLHYIPAGDKKVAYVCEYRTFDRHCPICDSIRDGIASAVNDVDRNMFQDAAASGRILVNAIDVNEAPNEPAIYALPPTVFESILNIIVENCDEDDESFNCVTDPKRGVEIIIEKSGAALNTKYSVQASLKPSKPLKQEVLAKTKNLEQYVQSELESGRAKALPVFRTKAPSLGHDAPEDSPFDIDDDVEYHESPMKAKEKAKAKPKDEDIEEGELSEDDMDDFLGSL